MICEFLDSLYLPFRIEEITCPDRACRVVGALWARGVRDPPPLHGASGVGGNGLTFHRRDPVNAEDFCNDLRTCRKDSPHERALCDLLDELLRSRCIAEIEEPHIIEDPYGSPCFNGVDADPVASPVHPSYRIQIADAEIGAEERERLVFEARGDVFSVCIMKDVRTMNDAARRAGVAHRSAPYLV